MYTKNVINEFFMMKDFMGCNKGPLGTSCRSGSNNDGNGNGGNNSGGGGGGGGNNGSSRSSVFSSWFSGGSNDGGGGNNNDNGRSWKNWFSGGSGYGNAEGDGNNENQAARVLKVGSFPWFVMVVSLAALATSGGYFAYQTVRKKQEK